MKSRIGVNVNATLVFEDKINSNNLGQTYHIHVKNVSFHHIEKELVRTVELECEIRNSANEVVMAQTFFTQQGSPFPFGKLNIALGMVNKTMVVVAVIHPPWMRVYPENQQFMITPRDVINHEPAPCT